MLGGAAAEDHGDLHRFGVVVVVVVVVVEVVVGRRLRLDELADEDRHRVALAEPGARRPAPGRARGRPRCSTSVSWLDDVDVEPAALELRRSPCRSAGPTTFGHDHRAGAGGDDDRHRVASLQLASPPAGLWSITGALGLVGVAGVDVGDEARGRRARPRRPPAAAPMTSGSVIRFGPLETNSVDRRTGTATSSSAAGSVAITRARRRRRRRALLARLTSSSPSSSSLRRRGERRRRPRRDPAPTGPRLTVSVTVEPSSASVPAGGSCSITVSGGVAALDSVVTDLEALALEQRPRLGRPACRSPPGPSPARRGSARRRRAPRRSSSDRADDQRAAAIAASSQPALGAPRSSGGDAARTRAVSGERRRPRIGLGRVERAQELVADWKRFAGSLASARRTTASSAGETCGLSCDGGRGCSETCFSATATGAVGVERDPAGERLVEHHADRVEVGGRGRLEALRLLGREVLGGPQHRAGLRDLRGAGAGDAEVGDPGAALAVDEHVLRLEVAVDDPALVGEARAGEDLADDLDRLADRSGRGRSGP